ncbi:3-phosphoshikimate 1-carboxyvinyltransferase [Halanaeroarchaeum sulfurireducens]|uniref:3-phosphoshikimate 1-carboxyvinyltransferase n=1 Tax=Halanaeroarchaeum sulfurireducens TaxID=1604004 RepID=A0A0F7PD62_9EURY|nr:3-phosphoshikimate 1-carboxyvinyltransferase [Halanaeroarchaeum sulfurireducens]AKH98115.1 3-phosphoshikimate 1-carboxyvinyltransferase [Halanaeroarchaeum sulfurireducens]ALG82509.1 3-phosphoshikimate 1-carboxyvinyltransferase [Halanaeroarchaeum sulfurireducens]
MDVTVTQSKVEGRARAPPSKSYTHRAILAAGYADGALIRQPLSSADTRATMRAVEQFGGSVTQDDDTIEVDGFDGRPAVPADVIDCANSGTTMRLTTATAALADGTTVLTGDSSLRSRPHGPLLDAIAQLGGTARSTRDNGQAPLVIDGPISGGPVEIPGDVSSQFITALLMAGAVTANGIDLTVTTELKSTPYVDVTLDVLDEFGVTARPRSHGYSVAGGQYYEPTDGEYTVPGDFSSASYLLAAGAVAGDEEVVVTGAFPNPQGDTAIVSILEAMGAAVEWNEADGVVRVRGSTLTGTTVDVGDTPDLLPTIAVLGAVAEGTTRIENCEHVRYKETDRVSAMAEALTTLGAVVDEQQDVLTVHGGESDLEGARVGGRGDHRIVMALAIAGLVADGATTISDAEHVDVSFPDFFDVLYDLGATVEN